MPKTRLRLALILPLTLAACKGGAGGGAIKNGSEVTIEYTLTVDGEVVDSSQGKKPLPYTAGQGGIIAGLDKQLLGLEVGDKKNVIVGPAEGYGLVRPELLQKVPRANFGDNTIKVGDAVQGSAQGQSFRATIVALNKKEVTLDLNHPLAGKTLNFAIEIVTVK